MAGNSLSFGVGGSPIKSIQRGVITISGGVGSATLSPAVDTTKSVLSHLGASLTAGIGSGTLVLTNSTTIDAAMSGSTGTVAWQLVEHY